MSLNENGMLIHDILVLCLIDERADIAAAVNAGGILLSNQVLSC